MLEERKKLLMLCVGGLIKKGVNNESYKSRLQYEIKNIDAQGEHEYFLQLHQKFHDENLKFPVNEHNSLVDYVLDLTDEFDIDKETAWSQGEMPDIDIDFLKPVRDYLKGEWAASAYGQENICEIGTYGTAGIKSSIIDMARVHGKDVHEIQSITTTLEDKDDEGKDIDWDKILEIATFQISTKEEQEQYKERLSLKEAIDWELEFSKRKAAVLESGGTITSETPYVRLALYCEENPDIASAARLFQGRNTHSGVHAGGLIISNQRIDGFVPLEVRKVNKDNPNGVICSAWSEGLAHQDLGPVGLIKFDLLVINNLMQIAIACELIKKRHGLKKIFACENDTDWSDVSYLNDPKAIEMANKGDLRGIFQFDGEGIRKLVKRGGVTSFEDLVAYSALYRPGPLNMGMDVVYCNRKKWKDTGVGEPYSIHPIMEKSLGKTYGVLVYQEQVMDILRVVGNIPDMHTEKVRKAISKKKVSQFIKYKEMFLENGQKNLNCNVEFVSDLWDQIESFAEYGFNRSHACAYTYVSSRLLYLKAHYPLEFYAATLMSEKKQDKFREYKLDAKYHDVEVCPVDINKSKSNFNIAEDNKIYFGFKNIKSVGEAVAERIVECQPYKDFADFINRFGTDAATIKALVALGVFDNLEPDYERKDLRLFHEFAKDKITKRKQRQQRFEASMIKKDEELRDLVLTEIKETDPDFEALCKFEDETDLWEKRLGHVMKEIPYKYKGEERTREVSLAKLCGDLAIKRSTSINRFKENEKDDEDNPISMNDFNPSGIKLDDVEIEFLEDSMDLNGEKSYPKAESFYYGFQWNHILETCTNYEGLTIDMFLEENDSMQEQLCAPIEIKINAILKRTSKSGVIFYSVDFEDANNRQAKINIFSDDYTRWSHLLKKGALLKIRMKPPSGGFHTFSFDSVPRHQRRHLPPVEEDYRIIEMKLPERKVLDNSILLDDLTFDAPAFSFIEEDKK